MYGDLADTEFSAQQIKDYYNYAVKNGLYHNEEIDRDLGKILQSIQEPQFSDLLTLSGLMYGTGAWEENAELLYDAGIPLRELIFCREDVYSYLYDKLKDKCCANPSGQVFEIKEAVCKGRYSHDRMPEETEKLLLACGVPKWYVESLKKILYLFPKTHLVTLLKRNICKFVH